MGTCRWPTSRHGSTLVFVCRRNRICTGERVGPLWRMHNVLELACPRQASAWQQAKDFVEGNRTSAWFQAPTPVLAPPCLSELGRFQASSCKTPVRRQPHPLRRTTLEGRSFMVESITYEAQAPAFLKAYRMLFPPTVKCGLMICRMSGGKSRSSALLARKAGSQQCVIHPMP